MATKVLVFESDAAFASELRNELSKLSCTTSVVEDGNVGLQQAAAEKPDLILLSIEDVTQRRTHDHRLAQLLAEKETLDPVLTPDGLRIRVPDYVVGVDAADPLISPLFGDLSGLPPLLIQAGSHEILLSDAVRLAGRAATDDVPVMLDVTPGVPHVFQGFAGLLDEGDAALDRAARFLKERFAAAAISG